MGQPEGEVKVMAMFVTAVLPLHHLLKAVGRWMGENEQVL